MSARSLAKAGYGKKSSFLDTFWRHKTMLLMLLPAVVYFIIFSYIPMCGIVLAFKEFNYRQGMFGSPWIGFENFKFFFQGGKAWKLTRNTLLYNFAFIFYGNFMQLVVAISLSELRNLRYKKLTQSLIFLPYFISWVLVGGFLYDIFNRDYGVIPNFLAALGLERPDIYGTPSVWPVLIVLMQSWKWLGYGSVIYLAAITSIDSSLNEAAMIDGANVFQTIWYVTLPCLKPTVVTLILMSLGSVLKGDYQMFYQLTGNSGLLYDMTDVIDTYVMRSLLTNSDYGMSAASGAYQSVFGFLFILFWNGLIKRIEPDYALF